MILNFLMYGVLLAQMLQPGHPLNKGDEYPYNTIFAYAGKEASIVWDRSHGFVSGDHYEARMINVIDDNLIQPEEWKKLTKEEITFKVPYPGVWHFQARACSLSEYEKYEKQKGNAPIYGRIKLGLYRTDSNGVIDNVLASTKEIVLRPKAGLNYMPAGWIKGDLFRSVNVLEGEEYFLAFVSDTAVGFRWKKDAAERAKALVDTGYEYGMPSPYGEHDVDNYGYSMYATYDVGGDQTKNFGIEEVYTDKSSLAYRRAFKVVSPVSAEVISLSVYHNRLNTPTELFDDEWWEKTKADTPWCSEWGGSLDPYTDNSKRGWWLHTMLEPIQDGGID